MNSKGKLITVFVLGMLAMGLLVWQFMPRMMFNVHQSPLGFDETVTALRGDIGKMNEWKVLDFIDFKKSIDKAGHGPMTRIGALSLCNPKYAARILAEDGNKQVTAMMPLSVGIYEDANGKVYVSELNVGLLGMMFGGTIMDVMGDAGADLNAAVKQTTGG